MKEKANYTRQVLSFIKEVTWDSLSEEVQHQSKRCLMDGLGALIAGHETPVGLLMETFAQEQFPGTQASILVTGKRVSVTGAVLANGFACNALDIDDGYRPTMGHIGACVLPVLLGAAQLPAATQQQIRGRDLLTSLVVGYEIGSRAGLIRHATYQTYHSSGSWGAVCGAAAAGKLLGLSDEHLWHALGTAEYHAPIAPMMKCIDVPSMGKDSTGWSCMVAIMSVILAQKGFTGIRPLFDDAPNPDWIHSLGREWEIMNQYFKPYSACRWAHPGIDGALKIINENTLAPDDIHEITVFTFEESAALSQKYPENTEEAQYNISFPIAAAILDGEVGPKQNLPPRIFSNDIRKMMDRITIVAEERFQQNFPLKAESEVAIKTKSGRSFNSGVISSRWDTHSLLPSDEELTEKFIWLTAPIIGHGKAKSLKELLQRFEKVESMDHYFNLCIR